MCGSRSRDGQWRQIAESPVIEQGWTAHFRIEGWDSTKDTEYRLRHGKAAEYAGVIRRDPVDKDVIMVAAFTGNSIYPGHGGDIPKSDIVENLKKVKPDLLFFSGDQVYDHNQPLCLLAAIRPRLRRDHPQHAHRHDPRRS